MRVEADGLCDVGRVGFAEEGRRIRGGGFGEEGSAEEGSACLGKARAGNSQLRRPTTCAGLRRQNERGRDETDGPTASVCAAADGQRALRKRRDRITQRHSRPQRTHHSTRLVAASRRGRERLGSRRLTDCVPTVCVSSRRGLAGNRVLRRSNPRPQASLSTPRASQRTATDNAEPTSCVSTRPLSIASDTAERFLDRVPTLLINRRSAVNRQPPTPSPDSGFPDPGTQRCVRAALIR